MLKSYDSLREDFIFNRNEKEYRHGYAEEILNISIGTQIKVLREQREWTQAELGIEADITQPMASRYENVNYSAWSLTTLKKLARAYDVWLDIRFRSFGELVKTIEEFSEKTLQVPKFSEDTFFKPQLILNGLTQVQHGDNVVSIDKLRKGLTGKTQKEIPLEDTHNQEGKYYGAVSGATR